MTRRGNDTEHRYGTMIRIIDTEHRYGSKIRNIHQLVDTVGRYVLINKGIKKPSKSPVREIAFTGVSSFQQNETWGNTRGEISDDVMRAFFTPRSNENCAALWSFLSTIKRWKIEPGENLARSWDGFVLAYWSFDPEPFAGHMDAAFLHRVHLRCMDVRRDDQARFGSAVSVPRGSKLHCVHLDAETWDTYMAELPNEPDDEPQDRALTSVDVRRASFTPIPVQHTSPDKNGRKSHRRRQ